MTLTSYNAVSILYLDVRVLCVFLMTDNWLFLAFL